MSHRISMSFPISFTKLSTSFHQLYFKPTPETLLEDQIILIPKLFSPEFCNEIIKKFNTLKLETTPLIKSREYAARVNDRLLIEDHEAAEDLWQYLRLILLQDDFEDNLVRKTFQDAKGLNPQLRIYRYTKGHYFGKHYDDSVKLKAGKTRWTLLIYLSGGEEVVGGDTIFYPLRTPLKVHPSKGMALLHKHGDDCLCHEAELVRNGIKWVLRSDVVF